MHLTIEKIKNMLFYMGLDKLDLLLIKKDIDKANTNTVKIISFTVFVYFFIMLLVSKAIHLFANYQLVYITGVIIGLTTLLLIKSRLVNDRRILNFIFYLFTFSLLMISAIQGAVISHDSNTLTFIVVLISISLFLIDRPIKIILLLLLSVCCFIPLALIYKDPNVKMMDIYNVIIFSSLSGIFSVFFVSSNAKRILYEKKIEFLSQFDILTRLYNRNMFEKCVVNIQSQSKQSLACIYIDANGLHELNNTLGHEAGDLMLKHVSSIIISVFGGDYSFRIGGDEFVIFLLDKDIEQCLDLINNFKALTSQNDLNVSIGLKNIKKNEISTAELINQAEKEMYRDKANYYSTHDRRKR